MLIGGAVSTDDDHVPYVVIKFRGEEVHRHQFDQPLTIGRELSCDLWVGDPRLSRQHCRIYRDEKGRWSVADLESRNGVYLDELRVKRFVIRDGESFHIGDTKVTFHAAALPTRRHATPLDVHHESLMTPVVGPVSDHVAPAQAAKIVRFKRRPPPTPQPKSIAEASEPLTRPFGLPFQRPAPRPILQAPTEPDQAIDTSPAQSQNWLQSLMRKIGAKSDRAA